MEAIRVFINQLPGCRQGTILEPKPAAWLLLPGSGAFGLETFWFGPATSESLQYHRDNATTKVGPMASGRTRLGNTSGTAGTAPGATRYGVTPLIMETTALITAVTAPATSE